MTRCTAMENPERTFLDPAGPVARHSLAVLTPEERTRFQQAAAATQKAKRDAWKTLDQHQTWADETHMRGFLVRYGVRIPSDLEPATPARLRTLVRRAGLTHEQWTGAVGCSLDRFLKLNPRLPLWAAVALVLESAS